MAGPVKAFNHDQGSSAAVVGPARSTNTTACNICSCYRCLYYKKW